MKETNKNLVGPIFDDRLKEKLLKPWKDAHSGHFHVYVCVCVCVSVCVHRRATEHSFWPRNLIFGLSDPWYMRKKHILETAYFTFKRTLCMDMKI